MSSNVEIQWEGRRLTTNGSNIKRNPKDGQGESLTPGTHKLTI